MQDPPPGAGPNSRPPVAGGEPVLLDRTTAERMDAATRYVERQYRPGGGGPPGHQRGARTWGYWSAIGKATSSISARSGTAYGTGTCTILKDTGSALADDITGVSVKNLVNKTIANNSYLALTYAMGSWWVVAVGDCANLS